MSLGPSRGILCSQGPLALGESGCRRRHWGSSSRLSAGCVSQLGAALGAPPGCSDSPKLAAGQGDPRETLLPGRGMPVSPGRMGATWCADCKRKQLRIEYSMGIAGAINSGWYKSLAETLEL